MVREIREKNFFLNKGKGAKQVLLPGAFLLFFGLLWYFSPLGIYPDSGSYISTQNGREPLYPVFLSVFRRLVKEGDTIVWLAASGQLHTEKAAYYMKKWPSLDIATFVQSMFAGIACYFLTETVRRVFSLNFFFTVLVGFCTLIPYVVTPFVSSSHMVLNKAVLTEGLAFPLFYCFSACMVKGLFAEDHKKKMAAFLWAFGFCLLLALTRNQMLITFGVWCVTVCFEIARRGKWKRVLLLFLSFAVFFGARSLINQIYNRTVHDGYVGADTGSYNLLTTMLYLSEEADGELISDKEYRQLFFEMREQMEAQGMTLGYAPKGILGRAYHYEEFYDVIGFQIQQPCMFSYVWDKGVPDGMALNEVTHIAGVMCEALFPRLWGKYAGNYLATVVSGFTRSVAASGFWMGIYGAFIYFAAFVLMVYLYRKDRQSRAALLMAFALVMISLNVLGTAVMIMCLSRYMIYNTALFYIAGLMCLRECWNGQKGKQR